MADVRAAIVEDAHPLAVADAARPRIVGMDLEQRPAFDGAQALAC